MDIPGTGNSLYKGLVAEGSPVSGGGRVGQRRKDRTQGPDSQDYRPLKGTVFSLEQQG